MALVLNARADSRTGRSALWQLLTAGPVAVPTDAAGAASPLSTDAPQGAVHRVFADGVRSVASAVASCGEKTFRQRRGLTVDLAIKERTAFTGRARGRLVTKAAYPRAGRQSLGRFGTDAPLSSPTPPPASHAGVLRPSLPPRKHGTRRRPRTPGPSRPRQQSRRPSMPTTWGLDGLHRRRRSTALSRQPPTLSEHAHHLGKER